MTGTTNKARCRLAAALALLILLGLSLWPPPASPIGLRSLEPGSTTEGSRIHSDPPVGVLGALRALVSFPVERSDLVPRIQNQLSDADKAWIARASKEAADRFVRHLMLVVLLLALAVAVVVLAGICLAAFYILAPKRRARTRKLVRIYAYAVLAGSFGFVSLVAGYLGASPVSGATAVISTFFILAVLATRKEPAPEASLGSPFARRGHRLWSPPGGLNRVVRLVAVVAWVPILGWTVCATVVLSPLCILLLVMTGKRWSDALWALALCLLVVVALDAMKTVQRQYVGARIGVVVCIVLGMYATAVGLPCVVLWTLARKGNPTFLVYLGIFAPAIISAIPKRRKERPEWVPLHRLEEPDIWGLVDDVSMATGQPSPAGLYLVADLNAFAVRVRGKNVMIVGLPLLGLLRVSELRAVIAHEFGHYCSGDTALAGYIYDGRYAVSNMITRLRDLDKGLGGTCFWTAVFRLGIRTQEIFFAALNRVFTAVVRSVVSDQERVADMVAAAVTSAGATRNALRVVARATPAFRGYWGTVVLPTLREGRRPRLVGDFRAFASTVDCASVVPAEPKGAEHGFASLRYHPPLHDRLDRLAGDEISTFDPARDPVAISLLRDADRYEGEVLTALGWSNLAESSAGA